MGFFSGKALEHLGVAVAKNSVGKTATEIREETREKRLGYDSFPLLHKANARITLDEAKACAVWIHSDHDSAPLADALKRETCKVIESTITTCERVFEATPVLFFDGRRFPCKRAENDARLTKRTNEFNEARALESESVALHAEANECARAGDMRKSEEIRKKALEKTAAAKGKYRDSCQYIRWPQVQAALEQCDRLRAEKYVALYEADAQVATALITKMVDVAVIEDSDIDVEKPARFWRIRKKGKKDKDYSGVWCSTHLYIA